MANKHNEFPFPTDIPAEPATPFMTVNGTARDQGQRPDDRGCDGMRGRGGATDYLPPRSWAGNRSGE